MSDVVMSDLKQRASSIHVSPLTTHVQRSPFTDKILFKAMKGQIRVVKIHNSRLTHHHSNGLKAVK